MDYLATLQAMATDPGVPFWVRDVIAILERATQRGLDPVDQANWLDTLARHAKANADRALLEGDRLATARFLKQAEAKHSPRDCHYGGCDNCEG